MDGIPAATITRMHSGWATTTCCLVQAQTSPLNFSIGDHTHGFLACTSTMRTERHIRDRREIQHGRRQGTSTSGTVLDLRSEFLYRGPHSWLSRMHLNDAHGAPHP